VEVGERGVSDTDLGLTQQQLRDLGAYLEERGVSATRRSREHTTAWLQRQGLDIDAVLAALNQRGGYSDWQILWNIVRP
jgi:hypothetical protein